MRLPELPLSDLASIGTYAAALWVPGASLAAAAGLRRWQLATTAPLFTYALAGLAGPVYALVGVRWSVPSFLLSVAIVVAVVLGARLMLHRVRSPASAPEPDGPWSARASLGVAAAAATAFVVGIVAILGGISSLSAVPQDWDAVFHANGIRVIADTGDGGLFAMGRVNWFEGNVDVFYPNAYHLVATNVYQLTGADIPTVLNAHTVLIPGLIGLSLIGMIHRLGGSPVLAGASALVAVTTTSFYDMLWRGPLLPFATGVALTPLAVVLVLDLVETRGARPILLFAVGAAGLLCLHPATLIGAVIFTVPVLVQRWWQRSNVVPRDILLLTISGAITIGLTVLQLGGSLSSAENLDAIDWPADLSTYEAAWEVLTYSHASDTAQWGLTAALVLGLISYRRLGMLRWIGVPATLFGTLFVIAASSDAQWANSITSLWWNDRFRLIAMAALPMCIIAGHGLAQAQLALEAATRGVLTRVQRVRLAPAVTSAAASLVVIVAFGLFTSGLYIGRDQVRMASNVGDGPAVSPAELAGMRAVAALIPSGSRVLNDRGDGSVWLYALTGIRSVAGHYDAYRTGADVAILADRFREYGTDPEVRAAVEKLDITFVMINRGFLRSDARRQPGLTDLDRTDFLRVVYRNPDLVLYTIENMPVEATTPRSGQDGGRPDASG